MKNDTLKQEAGNTRVHTGVVLKKSVPFSLVILISSALFLFGILAGGFAVYQNNRQKEQILGMLPTPSVSPTPAPSVSPSPSPSPTPSPTPKPKVITPTVPSGDFPVDQLQLQSIDPVWTGTPQNPVPFLNVNVSNGWNRPAYKVTLKLFFFRNQGDKNPYDTKVVTLLGVANPGSSTLRGNVPGFKPTGGDVYYYAAIVSASTQQ